MENKILFIGGTHGDEPIGVQVLQDLAKERSDFDWIIGNEPALQQNTREFEGNLNRSAPGDKKSPLYAPRRAAEILAKTKNYNYVIDLHGTNKKTDIFIIITNSKLENWQLATRLEIKNIVYWPSFSPELNGPLSEYFPCGLEIECGPKNELQTKKKLKNILTNFLDNKINTNIKQQKFEVYDSLKTAPPFPLKEFEETEIDGEKFFPLLIGSYQKDGVVCYKMRKIN